MTETVTRHPARRSIKQDVAKPVEKKAETLHDKILRLSGLDIVDVNVSKILSLVLERCSRQLPEDAVQRLLPFFALHTKTHEIDNCNFTQSISSIKILTKEEKGDSTSDSWILFGKIENFQVAVKLTFLPTATVELTNENSLEIERLIYRRVVNPMIICGFTPHVVAYYGEMVCDNFTKTLNDQQNATMTLLATELQKSHLLNPNKNPLPPPFASPSKDRNPAFDINKMRGLISERVIGELFSTLLKSHPVNASEQLQETIYVEQYLPIMFQVFYTIAVFAEIGLVHNDLHDGNVFVESYTKSIENCYLINRTLYKLDTRYQARIFDFDRGAKLATQFDSTVLRNTLLSRSHSCENYGQCQDVDERRELFTLCYFAYKFNKQKNMYLDGLLAQIVPIELLSRPTAADLKKDKIEPNKTFAWSGRLCACNDRDCETCTLVNDPRIKTPKEILAMPEFRHYVVQPQDVGNAFVWTLPSEAVNNPAERFRNAAK